MTTILVTLIFLLADGRPASKAYVQCDDVLTYAAGDDNAEPSNGGRLIVDRRGAVILEAPPKTIYCWARLGDAAWRGDVALKRNGQVERFTLEES